MRKLYRSLLAAGAIFGLAACGDDVSITEPPAPDLQISGAPVTAVEVGAKIQLSANQDVSWASSNSTVASVDGNGLVSAAAQGTASITATSTADATKKASVTITVTAPANAVYGVTVSPTSAILAPQQTLQVAAAVDADPGVARTVTWSSSNTTVASVSSAGVVTANAPGAASIIATSTANTAVAGSMALTVRAPQPAAISIQSVTAGLTNAPVNFNNIFGQIDVTLNVDPGDQIISKVEILLDNTVVYTQNFADVESQEMSLAAVSEAVSLIVGSIYTNEFDPVTGVVTYTNGTKALSARATVSGGTSVATPSLNLIFNNASGWVASMTNTGSNTGFPSSAVNTTTGFGWTQGSHTLTLLAVNYAAGVTYTNVNVTLFGVNTTLQPATGTQTFTATYSTSTWNGTALRIGNYMSAAGEAPAIIASTLSNGQAGATTHLNSAANAPPLGLVPMPLVRVDNTAPGNTSANGVVQAIATGSFAMPIWVNASYSYLPSAIFGSGADAGAGGVTKTYWTIGAGAALPGSANSCTFTGMTAVSTGSDLAETTVSTIYTTRVQTTDAVGNTRCYDMVGTNGADFIMPTIVSLTGPADLSASSALLGNYVFSVTDNASGFGATPVSANITRVGTSGSTACVVAPSGSCSGGFVGMLPLTFDATNGTNVVGYYNISNWTVSDQALNPTAQGARTYLYDNVPPAFSGGISLEPLYTGNATAAFNTAVTDDLDLASVYGVLTYPTGTFRYPPQVIGTYNVPLEKSATVAFNVSNFMRCVNAAADFATTTNKPNAVDLWVADQAANTVNFGGFAIPGANVETCGAVGASAINTFGPTTVTYESGKTQVDISGTGVAGASGTTATLAAVADVPINTSVDPFARVDFYWFDGTDWRVIGSSTGVLAQTPTTRTYTYTMVWDPASPVTAAVNTVVAVGVDSNGDAVFAATAAILLVP